MGTALCPRCVGSGGGWEGLTGPHGLGVPVLSRADGLQPCRVLIKPSRAHLLRQAVGAGAGGMWGTAALCGVGGSGGVPHGVPCGNPKGGSHAQGGVLRLGWVEGRSSGVSRCSPGAKCRGDRGAVAVTPCPPGAAEPLPRLIP